VAADVLLPGLGEGSRVVLSGEKAVAVAALPGRGREKRLLGDVSDEFLESVSVRARQSMNSFPVRLSGCAYGGGNRWLMVSVVMGRRTSLCFCGIFDAAVIGIYTIAEATAPM
jgi:hypothetical protein